MSDALFDLEIFTRRGSELYSVIGFWPRKFYVFLTMFMMNAFVVYGAVSARAAGASMMA